MSDVFREVEEDLRKEKFKSLAKRFGPYIAVVVILVIALVGGYSAYEDWQIESREEAGAAFAEALAQVREGEAESALDVLDKEATSGDGGFQILAAFAAAQVRAETGEIAPAVDGWRALAADSSAGQPLQDVARLLAVMHAMDDGEAASDLESELAPLAGSDRPLSYLARELTALLALRQGDVARARDLLTELSEDPQSPVGLRGRASQLLDSLGS
ncbi:MAG: tetratricopeptide repeat protein [Rhodospirillales bacterium]